jgi:hypothetical protein
MKFAAATTRRDTGEVSRRLLMLNVLFTDVSHTLVAIRQAASLGRSLHASLRVLMPIVVPYILNCRNRRLTAGFCAAGLPPLRTV